MNDNINKLSTVIDDLESQTKSFEGFTDILKKIDDLSNGAELLNKKMEDNANSHVSITRKLNENSSIIDTILQDLKKDLKAQFLEQSTNNKEIHKLIDKKIDEISLEIVSKNAVHIDSIEKKIDAIETNLEHIIERLKPKKKKWFFF